MSQTLNHSEVSPAPSAAARSDSGSAAPHPDPFTNAALWMAQAFPTLLILVALGAIAFWGSQTSWKLPKFSSLAGKGEAQKNNWCDAHSVPESECVECNANLMPKEPRFGWCPTHGVQDCPWEHPEIGQLRVKPSVRESDLEQARQALDFAKRPQNDAKCSLHPHRVQLASQEAIDKAGIDVRPVETGAMEETVAANGDVTFDPTRVASLSPPVVGRLWRVEKELGDPVRAGDVLALLDAAEVGKAKTEFLQALAQVDLRAETYNRLNAGASVVPARLLLESQAALKEAQYRLVSAQQTLVNLGIPVQQEDVKGLSPDALGRYMQFLGLPDVVIHPSDPIKRLDPRRTTANLLPIKAPFDGVVVSRKAALGEMADASKILFVVADPRRLWLTLNVRQDDLAAFKERDPRLLLAGRMVRFRPDGTKQTATGAISWVASAVDEKTRTLQVRAVLENPGGWLRANTFGSGTIVLRQEKGAVLVPSEAIHWEGKCNVVFVQDRNFHDKNAFKVFHVRTVRLGVRGETNTEIIAGLLPGEVVATANSGVLRAELLRASMGEG